MVLEKAYVQQVTKVSTKRSAYGDIVPDPSENDTLIKCRFRVISDTIRVNNREELRSDQAMVWFPPDTDISKNDIILYEGRYWEVIKINEARRLGRGTAIQFLKCWVSAHEVVS